MNSTAYGFVTLSTSNISHKTDFSLLSENRSNSDLMTLTEVHATGSLEVTGNKSVLLQKKHKNKTGLTVCEAV